MELNKDDFVISYDKITGLYTNFTFQKLLEKFYDKDISIICVDLDNFKNINILFGRNYGDIILKEIAKIILGFDIEIASRIGSDKFLIAKTKLKYRDVTKLLHSIESSIYIKENRIKISASIGVALYKKQFKEPFNKIIERSEIAMFEAKKSVTDKIIYFNNNLGFRTKRNARIIDTLYNCVDDNKLFLLFQPEIDLKTNKIVALEALIRLSNEELGMLSPSEFIPIAESTRTILQLGHWVLWNGCMYAKELLINKFDFGVISINISPIQLNERNFIIELVKILKLIDIDPKYLQIEITESSLINKMDEIVDKLMELKSYGITIALDDFGTTYSSLNYLANLPVDVIKIDKSFIDDIVNNSKKQIILKALIDMSHSLGYKVVAEGIEDVKTRDLLIILNCDIIQGYLVSPPVPPIELLKYFRQHSLD